MYHCVSVSQCLGRIYDSDLQELTNAAFCLATLSLKKMAACSFETSGNINPVTQNHIPGNLNPQPRFDV